MWFDEACAHQETMQWQKDVSHFVHQCNQGSSVGLPDNNIRASSLHPVHPENIMVRYADYMDQWVGATKCDTISGRWTGCWIGRQETTLCSTSRNRGRWWLHGAVWLFLIVVPCNVTEHLYRAISRSPLRGALCLHDIQCRYKQINYISWQNKENSSKNDTLITDKWWISYILLWLKSNCCITSI